MPIQFSLKKDNSKITSTFFGSKSSLNLLICSYITAEDFYAVCMHIRIVKNKIQQVKVDMNTLLSLFYNDDPWDYEGVQDASIAACFFSKMISMPCEKSAW